MLGLTGVRFDLDQAKAHCVTHKADDIVKNAPATEGHFFLVPKVVE